VSRIYDRIKTTPLAQAALEKEIERLNSDGTPKPKGGRPSTGFDKRAYMSAFMRDKRKADKLGLKVSEYRKLKGENE